MNLATFNFNASVSPLPIRRALFVVVFPLFLLACGGGGGGGPGSDSGSAASGGSGSGGTASGRALMLSWDPSPTSDAVVGYIVYLGSSVGSATQQVSDLTVSSGVIDPNAPVVTYNAGYDLGLRVGDAVCFRLKAYNAAGQSDFSSPACATI